MLPEDDEKDELEAPEKAPAPEPAPVPVPDPEGDEGLLMSLGWRKIEPVSNGSKSMSSVIEKYIPNVITNSIFCTLHLQTI